MALSDSDSGASYPSASRGVDRLPGDTSRFLERTVLNSDHKVLGLRYLWLALASVLVGMVLALVMRVHLVWPAAHIPLFSNFTAAPETYAVVALLHGSLMVFFVLTTAPQAGFGNYFLPLQIGAREVAFPVLNVVAFWLTILAFLGVLTSFFISPNGGLTLWAAGVTVFCIATLLTSINLTVTVLDLRAKGMSMPRMPLTVWAWLVNAILSMLIFSILLGACTFLLSDRLLGSQFFSPLAFLAQQSGPQAQSTLVSLWQRLFWFFAQAEVYVAILPCFGIVSHLLATFSRKPVFAERWAVLALCGVGLFGFCVWGEHIFSSALNPWSPLVFSVLASSLGIPASVFLVSWFGTLWKARFRLNTAMLFALGFVSLFLSGGVSGLFLASKDVAASAASNDFVTGHFHLVMGVAATFALLAALFFWFPKMFGRCLDERIGKMHFWMTFAGVYCVFMPMHWLGLMSGARSGDTGFTGHVTLTMLLRNLLTAATIVTIGAQTLFLINLLKTLVRGKDLGDRNPWLATTLEWSVASPPPVGNFGAVDPVVFRGAYEFRGASEGDDFAAQNSQCAPWETHSHSDAAGTVAKEAQKQQTQ